MGKLKGKQELFVREYLVDLNATQAAIRAGYSPKTAGVTGWENLNKPAIAEAITQAQAERAKRLEISADRVLQEIALVAYEDMGVVQHGPKVAALKLLVDHLGLKAPEKHEVVVKKNPHEMSDAELQEHMRREAGER